MLSQAQEFGEPLSVLMMDVDDFKTINDSYGHAVGDDTLKTIASVLRKNTRRGTDIPGRWGGDEFFVILPETTRYVAAEIAQRICRSIEQATILPDGTNITASIGVVSADREDTPGTLFKRVDEALYVAKQVRGKNDVVVR
jgi:diguanylate cyclase (GGDEF)-like protein